MRVPLSVMLDGTNGRADLTNQISNLRLKNVSPGGYASVEFDLPRGIDRALLQQYTDVLVYDTRTGEQCGGGRLMDQGRSVSEGGQIWQIAALGEGLASMQDREEPYFLIDQALDQWHRLFRNHARARGDQGTAPKGGNDDDGLVFEFDNGSVPTGARLMLCHRGPQVTSQLLGALAYNHDAGEVQADWRVRGRAHPADSLAGDIADDWSWTTTYSARRRVYCSDHFLVSRQMAVLEFFRRTSSGTATDNTWAAVYKPRVSAQRLDRFRAAITGAAYANDYVLGHEVFTDVVARFCPRLDIAGARIDEGVHQFEQLAWWSGVSPAAVMEDILEQDPAFTWHVWDRQSNALWETEYISMPTTVRYRASVEDGFSQPAPTTEVYNRVVVVGRTGAERPVSLVRTQYVPELDDLGLVRSATVDLGSELWSVAAATKAGDSFLAEHVRPPSAGTLTLARPVYDTWTGRWVPPWRVRAGHLIQIRGVRVSPEAMSTVGTNGHDVFRIVSASFSDDSATTVCELDQYVLTEQQAIADLMRKRTRR